MSKKKKKSKTIYIDDGRTIADMSGTYGKPLFGSDTPRLSGSTGTFKDKCKTYFSAVKMMFLPMLATIAAICVAFLILYLILELAA